MRLLLKIADTVSHAILLMFMVSVIVLALITSLLRYYLPQADQYREQLLQLVSQQTRFTVQADKLEASWQAFRPDISLHNVVIEQDDFGRTVKLDFLRLEINIVRTLFKQRLYIENLEARNLDIALRQNSDGKWSLSSGSASSHPMDADKVMDQLWSVSGFALNNLRLSVTPYAQQTLVFPDVEVSLQTWLNEKILQLDVREGRQLRSTLLLQTSAHPSDENFSANLYWRASGLPLNVFFSLVDKLDVPEQSRLSHEVWLQWQHGQLSGSGKFAIDQLQMHYADQPWQITGAAASFYVEPDGAATVLAIPALNASMNHQAIKLEHIKLRFADDISLHMQQLDLSMLTGHLQSMSLSPVLQELRDDLHPAGLLHNLHVRFSDGDFHLRANAQQLRAGAWKGAPALDVENAYIEAGKAGGFVQLDSPDFHMAFPKLFNDTLSFSSAKGTVFWQVDDDVIQVGSRDLIQLDGDYGNAIGEFQLAIPRNKPDAPHQPGRISIVVSLKNGDVAYRNYLLPKTLDEGLLQWLEKHIYGGQVRTGYFIYHGPIEHDAEEKKVVQLWLDVESGQVSYADRFPAVEQINGQMLLDQTEVTAAISAAHMHGMAIRQASVAMNMSAGQRLLTVSGRLQEPSARVLDFLQQPVFDDYTHGILQGWQSVSGAVTADAVVTAPLDDLSMLNVAVSGQLQEVALDIPVQRLDIADINGDLQFDLKKGLSARKLTGQLWGETLQASIVSKKQSVMSLSMPVDSGALQTWLNLPELAFLQGRTLVTGELYWGGENSGLRLGSRLQGVTIDLPQPFGKTADGQRRLTVQLPFQGAVRELRIATDDGVDLRLQMTAEGIDAGMLTLGMVTNNYRKGYMVVRGQLLQARADEWMAVVQRYQQLRQTLPADDKPSLALHIDAVSIRDLDLFGYRIDTVSFSAAEKLTGWLLELQQQHLSGTLLIDHKADVPLLIDVDHADLALLSLQPDSGSSSLQQDADALLNIPEMDVVVHELVNNGEALGQWQFSLRSDEQSLVFSGIEAEIRFMNLQAINKKQDCRLQWVVRGEQQTRVHCRLSSAEIDKVLKAWGYQQAVFSKAFTLDIVDGSWQGSPMDFTFMNSRLPLSITMEKGHFAYVASSATDTLKVLGIINVSNLVRRLQLDFSDLTQEGLSFDRFKGQMLLDQGVLNTQSPISIKGASSQIRMAGLADFNQDQLDMNMTVSLPLASNLPWVVALAAGLPAAAGVFVVSKMLGKQVDKLSTAVYDISGSMQEPQIRFRHFFDVGSADKKNSEVSTTVTEEQ